ncbi:MAG: hypothetical protein KDE27_01275 [Planctomycetes bacterium]|nr:hypothetical protein [Planctomycetota bacterium]
MNHTSSRRSVFALSCALFFSTASALAHVALIAPNGGEVLPAGSVYTIRWQIVIPHTTLNWDLEYSISGPNGPWLPIALDLPANTTSYQWTVPNTPSDHVRVRVTQDNSGTDYIDISDNDLAIVPSASYTAFGQGCANATGTPALAPTAGSVPALGSTSQLRASNLDLATHAVIFLVGFSATQNAGAGGSYALPLALGPYGFPGCAQLVSDDSAQLAFAQGGIADWSLTVPNDPSLAGVDLFAQAWSFASATLAVSNGQAAVLGY